MHNDHDSAHIYFSVSVRDQELRFFEFSGFQPVQSQTPRVSRGGERWVSGYGRLGDCFGAATYVCARIQIFVAMN